jgi:hypothetical protein
MNKLVLLFLFFLFSYVLFCQTTNTDRIKPRKLTYNNFVNDYSTNDTSVVIIDLFFTKKENAVYNQMSLLPISLGLTIIPQTRLIGVGTTFISFPLFMNGGYVLIKYRKKKLYKVLVEYNKTKTLPKWVRRKVNKLLDYYDAIQTEY